MSDSSLHVRGVDSDLWRRLRAEAVRRGLNAGVMLNQIIEEWLNAQRKESGHPDHIGMR